MRGEQQENLTGSIKFYDLEKGYGFITCDQRFQGEKDAFFLIRDVMNKSNLYGEGDRVNFRLVIGKRGPRALEVEVLK